MEMCEYHQVMFTAYRRNENLEIIGGNHILKSKVVHKNNENYVSHN